VLNRIVTILGGAVLAAALGLAQQAQSQTEYQLTDAIGKGPDLNKRLALLDQWTKEFPETPLKQNRSLTYLDTYSKIASKGLQPGARARIPSRRSHSCW
jgi:hypothetical protein